MDHESVSSDKNILTLSNIEISQQFTLIPRREVVRTMSANTLFAWLSQPNMPGYKLLGDTKETEVFENAQITGKEFLDTNSDKQRHLRPYLQQLRDGINNIGLPKRTTLKRSLAEGPGEDGDLPTENIAYQSSRDLYNQLVRTYADSQFMSTIAFPVTDTPIPDRFALNESGAHFSYLGRRFFSELYAEVATSNSAQNFRFFLHGPLGVGKSHLLAALVNCLREKGEIVIYIPDCYQLLLSPPGRFMISAITQACKDCRSEKNRSKLKEHLPTYFPTINLSQGSALGSKFTDQQFAEQLVNLCWDAGRNSKGLKYIFVIDQANAFDPAYQVGEHDRISEEKKKFVRKLLDEMGSSHIKLESSTANYKAGRYDELRSVSEKRLVMLGGLTEEELTQWWGMSENAGFSTLLSETEKAELHNKTGQLPIYLSVFQRCVKQYLLEKSKCPEGVSPLTASAGELTSASQESMEEEGQGATESASKHSRAFSAILKLMYNDHELKLLRARIGRFAIDQHAHLSAKGELELAAFVRAWKACVYEEPVNPEDTQYLDGRFFYIKDGTGRCSCDFAREAAAARLKEFDDLQTYANRAILQQIRNSGTNPSVLGFLVEAAVIGSLIRNGLCIEVQTTGDPPAIDLFKGPVQVVKFSGKVPSSTLSDYLGRKRRGKNKDQCFIFIPTAFNYQAVDTVLVYMKGGQGGEISIQGVQITIAGMHSKSHENWINLWKQWAVVVEEDGEKVEWFFTWITEHDTKEWVNMGAKTKRSRNSPESEVIVTPAYKMRTVNLASINGELSLAVRYARTNAEK